MVPLFHLSQHWLQNPCAAKLKIKLSHGAVFRNSNVCVERAHNLKLYLKTQPETPMPRAETDATKSTTSPVCKKQ